MTACAAAQGESLFGLQVIAWGDDHRHAASSLQARERLAVMFARGCWDTEDDIGPAVSQLWAGAAHSQRSSFLPRWTAEGLVTSPLRCYPPGDPSPSCVAERQAERPFYGCLGKNIDDNVGLCAVCGETYLPVLQCGELTRASGWGAATAASSADASHDEGLAVENYHEQQERLHTDVFGVLRTCACPSPGPCLCCCEDKEACGRLRECTCAWVPKAGSDHAKWHGLVKSWRAKKK